MAARSQTRTELQISRRWEDISSEQPQFWSEPPRDNPDRRQAAVVYYLSRNGQLQHPHFMEVPFSSSQGLYLKDVICRLNSLRGRGIASLYSWSAKRRYKSGFVWQDLEEEDLIHPTHDHEYILKGSELRDEALTPPREDCELPAAAAERSPGKRLLGIEGVKEEAEAEEMLSQSQRTELSRGEISPPPQSGSSPETLERLLKADGRVVLVNESQTEEKFEAAINKSSSSCFRLRSLFY
ncbi:unnamed protein product [Cuscuta epithymum]|uniref:SOSEKI DIX-like domain-containing protein n=1 Tax=Cuscuta epithymum TaxID=186058 RepID=A0AAV0GIJ4_9ASTE|nr:unnamed protein product [Cuscuta epithymum]CAH9147316.1 unnamed protein product [Cuscuta epithymum]